MKPDKQRQRVERGEAVQPTAGVHEALTKPYDDVSSDQQAESSASEPYEPDTVIDPTAGSFDEPSGERHRVGTPSAASSNERREPGDSSGTYAPATKQLGSGAPNLSDAYRPAEVEIAQSLPSPAASTDSDDPLEGTRYRKIELLGFGAMGEVYAAEDTDIEEPAVVKVLRADMDESAAERMRREAHALAKLSHPNIVQISRFARTPKGRWFIAMERLYGRTLADEMKRRGPLLVDEAVHYGLQILEGLGAAHAQGLLHRDIKLSNLFLCDTPEGRVIKIVDFGLVKALDPQASCVEPLEFPTAEGTFLGTPRWAAPEAVQGVDVDHRTDLYGVALVLLSLLSGHDPFPDVRGIHKLLMAHLHSDLDFSFSGRRDPVPPPIVQVLRKALSKFPEARHATAAEFATDLRAALRVPFAPDSFSFSVSESWTSSRGVKNPATADHSNSSFQVPISRVSRVLMVLAIAVGAVIGVVIAFRTSTEKSQRVTSQPTFLASVPSAPQAAPPPSVPAMAVYSVPSDTPASSSSPSGPAAVEETGGQQKPPREAKERAPTHRTNPDTKIFRNPEF